MIALRVTPDLATAQSVRDALAVELARIDVAISTRAASGETPSPSGASVVIPVVEVS